VVLNRPYNIDMVFTGHLKVAKIAVYRARIIFDYRISNAKSSRADGRQGPHDVRQFSACRSKNGAWPATDDTAVSVSMIHAVTRPRLTVSISMHSSQSTRYKTAKIKTQTFDRYDFIKVAEQIESVCHATSVIAFTISRFAGLHKVACREIVLCLRRVGLQIVANDRPPCKCQVSRIQAEDAVKPAMRSAFLQLLHACLYGIVTA
jgi:hypothetical protein